MYVLVHNSVEMFQHIKKNLEVHSTVHLSHYHNKLSKLIPKVLQIYSLTVVMVLLVIYANFLLCMFWIWAKLFHFRTILSICLLSYWYVLLWKPLWPEYIYFRSMVSFKPVLQKVLKILVYLSTPMSATTVSSSFRDTD